MKRLRTELGWQGRLILLMGTGKSDAHFRTPEGLAELAAIVDGIGPDISSVISADRKPTPLVRLAHAQKLAVHPYTLRTDQLPEFAKSTDDLLELLFGKAGIDGLFTDFPDTGVQWLKTKL